MSFSRGKQRFFFGGISFLVSGSARIIANKKDWLTLSNFLTSLRLVLAPCICLALYCKQWNVAAGAFFFAAGTDFFDGFFARFFNECTLLGRILDPIADKMLLLCSVGGLAFCDSPFFHIPPWFFGVVVIREMILVIGGGIVAWKKGSMEVVNPSLQGKFATCMLLLFLSCGFITPAFTNKISPTTKSTLIGIILFFYIGSFFCYAYRGFYLQKTLKND